MTYDNTLNRDEVLDGAPKPSIGLLGDCSKFEELRIELTNACQYKCFMCPRPHATRGVGIMTDEDLDYVLSFFPDHDGFIQVHGFGDPFILPNIADKIDIIRRKTPKARVYINTTLGYEISHSNIERILASGKTRIAFSIYGHTREAYKKVFGMDRFELALKNFHYIASLLKKYDLRLAANIATKEYILSSGQDINLYNDFIKFCKDNNIETVVQTFHDYGIYNLDARRNPLPCNVAYGFYARHLVVTWDLDVIPCCLMYNKQVVLGNLRQSSIQEIANSDAYKNFIYDLWTGKNKDKYPICHHCRYFVGSEHIGPYDKDPYKLAQEVKDYVENCLGKKIEDEESILIVDNTPRI